MKSVIIFVLVSLVFLLSCKSSRSKVTEAEISYLNQVIQNKNFKIESTWANPQVTNAMQQVLNSGLLQPGSNASSINLIGNSNFLKISGDSIFSYLPYFGERQMNVNYGGTDGAIKFKGLMQDYKVEKRKDSGYNISFQAKSNTENFDVFITLWPNLKTSISLNSASRFPINYTGNIIK
ncbi:DUF4251 domain-containing protein [Neotamlana laminarinivorans]|uniref:DUF4251 domain-containing protein n=1 Tax=Neotamlana laminarinivorans TaxID=2883124 RepID=A0A9X1HZX3_9FLAO|nr:DUF4251 domain-containing protein [Tamlana laminarinivorans]MCB4797737.1 DUF4251 domain-containing protein [Tamlana laminarinivorans]